MSSKHDPEGFRCPDCESMDHWGCDPEREQAEGLETAERRECPRCHERLMEYETGDLCERCEDDLDELDALEPKL